MENNYQYQSPVPAPKKPKGTAAKTVALALCCSVAGGLACAGSFALYDTFRPAGFAAVENTDNAENTGDGSRMYYGERGSEKIQSVSVDTSKTLTAAEIYAANVNSTVGITTSVTTNRFGYRTQAAASGSGFILTSSGYIVTNYHVVEGAETIKVTTYDDKTYEAKLTGYDESNDVAVLKIEATDLTPVVIGNSDNMNVGDSVVAIGNPLGELTFSLTTGAVSALNRKVTIENTAMNLIQTDCAINSGNSGGALFNSHGEVIGITNAKYSSSGRNSSASIDNIGFAIPMNSVSGIITSIIEKGYVEKVYIGVNVSQVTSGSRRSGTQDTDTAYGLEVQSVTEDSPAEKAGISEGDVITEFNGEKLTSVADLNSLLNKCKEGDEIVLTVLRDGETQKIKVTLGVRQQAALPDSKSSSSSQDSPDEQDDDDQGGQNFPGYPGSGRRAPSGD